MGWTSRAIECDSKYPRILGGQTSYKAAVWKGYDILRKPLRKLVVRVELVQELCRLQKSVKQ